MHPLVLAIGLGLLYSAALCWSGRYGPAGERRARVVFWIGVGVLTIAALSTLV